MQFFAYAATGSGNGGGGGTNTIWHYWADRMLGIAYSKLGARYDNNEKDSDFKAWGKFNTGAWCVDFVRWCAYKCGLLKQGIMPLLASSSAMCKWYADNQPETLHMVKKDSDLLGIQPGDIVFTLSSYGNHTAMAVSAYKNGTVDTLNGNWGGNEGGSQIYRVREQKFPITGNSISAWVHPHYESQISAPNW